MLDFAGSSAGSLSVGAAAGPATSSPLSAAVLSKAGWTKSDASVNQDKTAAVIAELRRPTADKDIKKSTGVSAGQPAEQTSGISAFSQTPVSELLVRLYTSCSPLPNHFCYR